MNIVETFQKFNKGQRRPNRKRHLELCGFEMLRVIYPRSYGDELKPIDEAKKFIFELSEEKGVFYHAVTLPLKNYDGWTYYQLWVKSLG